MTTNLPPKTASDMLKTGKGKPVPDSKKQRLVGDDVMNEPATGANIEADLKRTADQNDKRHQDI